MFVLKRKKGYRRGYPVALLVGLQKDRAVLWKIFSNVVKVEKTLLLEGNRNHPKVLYNFHESLVNTLRPTLKEGVKSVVLVSPKKTNYTQKLIKHLRGHHGWLMEGPNRAIFSEMTGSACQTSEVVALTKKAEFHRQICETTSDEAENLLEMLEKHLNSTNKQVLFYSLEETEELVIGMPNQSKPSPDYILLTDKYLSSKSKKRRIHRLLQIAQNKNVKTRIFDAESQAGVRLSQFGGLVCLAHVE